MNLERPQGRDTGRVALLLATIALASGCTILCDREVRLVNLWAKGLAGSATTEAGLTLIERRGNAEAGQYVGWSLNVDPRPDDTVKAVRLRVGTPAGPGEVLYDLPLPDKRNPVVMLLYMEGPYAGEIPFDDLWNRVRRQPTFVEAVFAGESAPIGVGPLQFTMASDWHKSCPD